MTTFHPFRSYRRALRAVLASYPDAKRREDAEAGTTVLRIYRPISFLITPLFLAAGVSPNAATALGIVAALAMPAVAVLGAHAYLAVAALAFFYHVMDHVDGNLARVTRTFTVTGDLLERLHAIVFWPLYLIAVGILAHGTSVRPVGRHGVAIGLGLAALILVKREIQEAFEAVYPEDVRWGHHVAGPAHAETVYNLGYVVEHAFAMGVLVVAGALGHLDHFLVVTGLYVVIVFLTWLPSLAATVRRHAGSRVPPSGDAP